MRMMSKLLPLILAATLQPAFADVVLTFNDITPAVNPDGSASILLQDRYLVSDGVQFIGSALGVSSYKCIVDPANDAGFGFIDVNGGCGGAVLLSSGDTSSTFTINFADGFSSGSSFVYSAIRGAGVIVKVFDELDGQGNATIFKDLTTSTCGTNGVTFCNWPELLMEFSGTAYSIVVSGADESFMLDKLSLLAADPTNPNPTPEPGSVALALGALGALAWTRKRRAR